LNIINPTFKIQNEESNLFTIRQKDFEQILPLVQEIVKPVEEIGFNIIEVDLKESRFSSGELSKTIKQTLNIKFQKGSSNIDLSIFIPKLVNENYLMINGKKKIPIFQLFDIPVVTRGESIKIRTNVATMMIYKDREAPSIRISLLGKKVPFSLILCAYYSMDEVVQKFDLELPIDENSDDFYEILRKDLKKWLDSGWRLGRIIKWKKRKVK